MGRAKGSPAFLEMAKCLADGITMESHSNDDEAAPVYCNGAQSIFGAVGMAMPTLVRTQVNPQYRQAISEIELNKVLAQAGYVSRRRRNRVPGSKNKWESGFRYWSNRRWCNSFDAGDMVHLHSHLAKLKLDRSEYDRVLGMSNPAFLFLLIDSTLHFFFLLIDS